MISLNRPLSLIAFLALATGAPVAQTQTKALPRLYVFTDKSPGDGFLKEREQSVKDLRHSFGGRKKVLTVTDAEEKADVVIEVVELTTTVPKVSIGVGSRTSTGSPGMTMPARAVHLRVRATRGEEAIEFTNKTTPLGNPQGWTAAADDVAKQIEKWLLKAQKSPFYNPPRPVAF